MTGTAFAIFAMFLSNTQISITASDFILNDGSEQQVTAREGKPILIVEEGDTETCKWAEHSLEVTSYTSLDPYNLTLTVSPARKKNLQNKFCR